MDFYRLRPLGGSDFRSAAQAFAGHVNCTRHTRCFTSTGQCPFWPVVALREGQLWVDSGQPLIADQWINGEVAEPFPGPWPRREAGSQIPPGTATRPAGVGASLPRLERLCLEPRNMSS
ncbi:hypothetical protein D3C79_812240 [compost metagenome]